jgi:tetratricopeptide (TPR) repeat protein
LASAQIGIGLHPGHIKLNTLIGEIYRKQNKNSKALEKWNKSLELWKGFGRAHWLIGEYYLSEDSLDKAKSYFINAKYCNGPISERASKSLQLIDSMENKPYLRNGVAQHFITKLNGFGSINDTSSVRLKKVIKRIKAYVELDSTNAELRAHLGIGYMMLESYTKAAITFEKAVELNPNYPQMREYLVISRVNLGAKLFEKDSLEEAIFHFRYALDYSPNNENVRANLSVAYNEMARKAFDNNELETAYAILKAAIFYNQENPTSFVQMGRLQLAINQKDSAEIAFNQAFRIDPSNEEALQELIVFYKKRSDYYKVKIYTDRLNKLIKRQLTK